MGNVCGRRNKDGAVSNGGWEPLPEDEGFNLADGDIIITTFPKCGTTWMQYIVLTLLYKGDASKIKNMDIQSPFLEDMAKGKGKGKGFLVDDWENDPVHMGKWKGGDLWDESMLEKDGLGKGKDKDKDKGKDKGKDKDKDKKGKDKKGKDKKGKDKKGKGKDKDPEEEKMLRGLIAWDDSNWFEGRPKPSVFKTHRMPDSVLWEGGVKEIARCKCIVVTRNPKDAMISLYRQELDNSLFIGLFSDWVELFTSAFKARGGQRIGCFWKWHAEWWQVKTTYPDNVLWISFEEMKKDNPAQVRKVAAFLGIEASEELVQQCVEAAKFGNMKEKAGPQVSSLLRKGTSGGWREELKGKALEHFDRVHQEKMKEYAIPFEFDFGPEG